MKKNESILISVTVLNFSMPWRKVQERLKGQSVEVS